MFQVVAVFLTLTFHKTQGSDAFDGWWDILLPLYYKFTAKSVGEKILTSSSAVADKPT